MKTFNLAKILTIFAIALIISIPICLSIEKRIDAVETSESITSYDGDYIFFIIEENAVPLASAPTTHTNSLAVVSKLIFAISLLILVFVYIGWYMITKHNLDILTANIHYSLISDYEKINILHPIKLSEYSKDVEYRITQKYIY